MAKARIVKVIWVAPGAAEGDARTLSEALIALRQVRQRAVLSGRAYIIVCRQDGTQDRIEV
jgi:hypothetical protein